MSDGRCHVCGASAWEDAEDGGRCINCGVTHPNMVDLNGGDGIASKGLAMPNQPRTVTLFWCPACGWDDQAWGPDFWQRHHEPGEDRKLGLDCLDGGGPAVKLTYELRSSNV